MNKQEATAILQMNNAAIIAPAGHGKTEMIADLMECSEGRWLLLTHTNAGVAAMKKRMKIRNIPTNKYVISTIAGFCIKWCMSYKHTAEIDDSISPLSDDKNQTKAYYDQMYAGAKKIFSYTWATKVLSSTYSGIVVDEYQDCTKSQHEIFCEINGVLPVIVLGDPMQAIFSFAGALVNWDTIPFKKIEMSTYPWRWEKSNKELGKYLTYVRKCLLPILNKQSCHLHIDKSSFIELINPHDFDTKSAYPFLKDFQSFSSVVYITKWEPQQLTFSKRMAGYFQYNETQECKILFDYALEFDEKKDIDLALSALNFASECFTKVKDELKTYINHLEKHNLDFKRITKNMDFGSILLSDNCRNSYDILISILEWIKDKSIFKLYRSELFSDMLRSIKMAQSQKTSIYKAAQLIRSDTALRKEYSTNTKFLSSRTLLSKGLEFDCVIIDMRDQLSAKDFYVAMTRAMKKIYIISETCDFQFTE